MVRKPFDRPLASLFDTLEGWFAKPARPAAGRRSAKERGRRLGYESLEGRAVFSATGPGTIIQGEVYNDTTGQGQPSDGPGLAAVTVNLYKDGGDNKFEGSAAGTDDSLVGSQQTNSTGNYSFSNLAAGTYYVQEVLPSGFVLPSGGSSVSTIVVTDADVTGTKGISIDSFTTTQQVVGSSLTTTSATQASTASEAIGGNRDMAVQLTSPSGAVDLYSNLYDPDVLEYDSSATATGVGTVIWDGAAQSGSTVQNPTGLNHADLTSAGNATGITLSIGADHDTSSVTLNIYTNAGSWSTITESIPYTGGQATVPLYLPFSSFSTGGGGGATFSNVGAVQLIINGATGAHAEISGIYTVGPTHLTANFANYQTASIGTYAFWDTNSNGVRDNSEVGAANVGVQLMQGSTVVATTTTNSQGAYSFTGLAPGSYSVKFSPGNGTLFTSEAIGGNPAVYSDVNSSTGSTPVFTLTSGENDANVNAGLLPVALSIVKTVNNPTPVVGTNVNFTITLSNATGVSQATGVTVSDVLPAGLTFVSATASQGSYSSNTGVWTVGSLAAGATTTLLVTATVVGTSTMTNNVQVTGSDEVDSSPASALKSSATVTPVQQADLQLSKTVDNATPNVGQNVTFTITLNNLGPGQATGVTATDVLPVGLTYVSSATTEGTYNSSTGLWTVGTVSANGVALLQITATAATPGQKTNTATITHEDEPDPNPNNNTGTAIVTPQQADLAITKTVNNATPNVGQNVTYTITVNNAGPSTATDVISTDILPAGLTFVSDTASQGSYNSETGAWTIGTMASGATPVTLTLTATVNTAGTKTNTVSVTGDQYDPNLNNNTASASINAQQADLAITKTVNNSEPTVGQNATFTITVSNSGPSTATGVTTTDTLPAGLTFVSDTATQGSYNSATGVWTIGSLPSGGTPVTLTLVATVATAGSKTNTATVTGGQFDPNLSNNTASATVVPQADVDLTLTKSVDNPLPSLGTDVNFTITVNNAAGEATATNVVAQDLLPSGLIFVSAVPSQGSYNSTTGNWTIGSLAAGSTVSMTITALVATMGTKTNEVTVTTDQPDPNGGTPAFATVVPVPDAPPNDTPTPVPTPTVTPKLSKAFFLGR